MASRVPKPKPPKLNREPYRPDPNKPKWKPQPLKPGNGPVLKPVSKSSTVRKTTKKK